MDEFRSMRLVRKEGDKNMVINIKVEFDKTKHLSDSCIKRRKAVRERLMAKDREREEEEMKKQLKEAEKLEKERFDCLILNFLQRSLGLPQFRWAQRSKKVQDIFREDLKKKIN